VDDVLVMHRGRLLAAGPLTELAAGTTLEHAFLTLTGALV
jgi:hypothetical protein